MPTHPYRFEIDAAVPLDEAEMTLQLTMLALEGLYGQAAVRLDGHYQVDEAARTITVDGGGDIGSALVRVFTALLTREFGEDAFSVSQGPTDARASAPAEAVA